MKIAIPCENGEVMQHFGHATEFTVYTIEDIKPIKKETVTFDDTCLLYTSDAADE